MLGEHKKFAKMIEKMGKMNIDDSMDNVSVSFLFSYMNLVQT